MGHALKGHVAMVTGGGRGIGRTIALALGREGADVALVARTAAEIQAVEKELRVAGARACAIPADLSASGVAEGVVKAATRQLGAPEILVNAAAVQGPIGRFDRVDVDAWIRAVQVDLIGPAAMTHAVLGHMVEAGRGKIINLSGGGAAGPRPGFSAYAASKAALVRFTETLAEELRDLNIQVNAMAPGATRTRMTEEVLAAPERAGDAEVEQAQRIWATGGADPKRQAALAVFLASDESNHVTGRLIHVNDAWEEFLGPGPLPDDLYRLRRVNPTKVGVS